MKANKSTLSSLITWSSSRYNESKKNEIINDIIFRIEKGEDCVVEYSSGCYSETAHTKGNVKWTGGYYTLEIVDGIAKLKNYTKDWGSGVRDEVILDKPVKNKFFVPAKTIYHEIEKWGVPIGNFDVTGQDVASFHIIYNNKLRYINKDDCTVVAYTDNKEGISDRSNLMDIDNLILKKRTENNFKDDKDREKGKER